MSDNWDDMDMDEEDDTSDTVKPVKPVKPATNSKSISEQIKEKIDKAAKDAKKKADKAKKDLKKKMDKAAKDLKEKMDKAKKDIAKRFNPFHFIQIDDEATSHSNSKTDSIDLPIFAEVKNNKMKKTNLRKVKSLMNQEELHQAYSLLLQKSNLLLSKI